MVTNSFGFYPLAFCSWQANACDCFLVETGAMFFLPKKIAQKIVQVPWEIFCISAMGICKHPMIVSFGYKRVIPSYRHPFTTGGRPTF